MKLIGKGAEAEIYEYKDKIIKKRVQKGYRLKELDVSIRLKRNRFEKRLLEKAHVVGVNVPKILESGEYEIILEKIKGEQIKNVRMNENLIRKIAVEVAKLHNNNIIHGDLTTSNIIKSKKDVYIIDFGLGFVSDRKEDKAMDLKVFFETLEVEPRKKEALKGVFIEEYIENSSDGKDIVDQLKDIESRGRYIKRKKARRKLIIKIDPFSLPPSKT